jgi:uncharacterized protein YraI
LSARYLPDLAICIAPARRVLAVAALAMLGLSTAATAQSREFMMNECSSVGQTFFRNLNAPTPMQYNGQRTDGTHAINGTIYLGARTASFACSYDRSGQRMVALYADGRLQNAYLPGGGGGAPSGGGDIVRVTGVASNDVLNVRSGPGTNYGIVGALGNGDRVRNLRCQTLGSARWCELEMMTDMRERGWVNGRYLTAGQGAATQLPESPGSSGAGEVMRVTGLAPGGLLNVRGGPGTSFRVTGALGNGDTVQSLGCESTAGGRWCRIQMMTDMRETGWVSARYLTVGAAVQLASTPPSAGAGQTTTVRVRFPTGASGTELTGSLAPGASRRYLLGGRNSQMLYFRLAATGPDMSWQIINPDDSLMDRASSGREYRGSLWQSGDHVVEVINRSNRTQGYTVIFGIN